MWKAQKAPESPGRAGGPPPARPRLGPDGSCPRSTNSARTTSRPVTRTCRRAGDPPPTPHRMLGRGGRSCPLEPHPDAAGPTGDSGDSDTFTKARRNIDVRPGRPGWPPRHPTQGARMAAPGRPRATGHKPRPRTGTWGAHRNGPNLDRARADIIPQVIQRCNSAPTNRTGQTRTPT